MTRLIRNLASLAALLLILSFCAATPAPNPASGSDGPQINSGSAGSVPSRDSRDGSRPPGNGRNTESLRSPSPSRCESGTRSGSECSSKSGPNSATSSGSAGSKKEPQYEFAIQDGKATDPVTFRVHNLRINRNIRSDRKLDSYDAWLEVEDVPRGKQAKTVCDGFRAVGQGSNGPLDFVSGACKDPTFHFAIFADGTLEILRDLNKDQYYPFDVALIQIRLDWKDDTIKIKRAETRHLHLVTNNSKPPPGALREGRSQGSDEEKAVLRSSYIEDWRQDVASACRGRQRSKTT